MRHQRQHRLIAFTPRGGEDMTQLNEQKGAERFCEKVIMRMARREEGSDSRTDDWLVIRMLKRRWKTREIELGLPVF